MANEQPAGGGGFALDIGDAEDPFNTDVKVNLTGIKAESKTEDEDDKGAAPGGKSKDTEDHDDKARGSKTEDDGVKARGDDDDLDEDEGGLDDRTRLRASRRNAKRLKRALGRVSGELTRVQIEQAETQGMVVNLVKSNIENNLHAAESRLVQVRATKIQAREKDDHATEQQCEDEIGNLTQQIAGFKGQKEQLAKLETPKAGNAMLTNWMSDAEDWYQKPGFETETQKAQAISQQLAAQGIGRGDPRHYDEIDRQMRPVLKKRFADMGDDGDDQEAEGAGSEKTKTKEREEPMRGVAGGGKRQASGGGGRGPQVPKALVDTWRAGGFDVTKPEVQKKMWDRYNETKQAHGF